MKSDTVANEPALIIFLEITIEHKSKTIFIDLAKLEHKEQDSVFKAIIKCLTEFGLSMQKIKDDLIQVVSDGASVFVEKKSEL